MLDSGTTSRRLMRWARLPVIEVAAADPGRIRTGYAWEPRKGAPRSHRRPSKWPARSVSARNGRIIWLWRAVHLRG